MRRGSGHEGCVNWSLIEDAISAGWDREVDRHRCATKRIEQLLEELGEPFVTIDEVNRPE
jgi:hypothetical protein